MQKSDQPKKYTLSSKSSADRGVTFKQKTTARPQYRGNEKRTAVQALHKPRVRLNTLEATAICGNDITSSCVYVSAITASYAGGLHTYRVVAGRGGALLISQNLR